MAEKLGLDNEVHELKLGSSFGGGQPVAYHSIRYDFKPASVDTSQVANVDIGEGNSVTVTVPHVEGSGTSHTLYKGNKKPCQKECVLIIDHQTGEITLEKLATSIQLKKTSSYSQYTSHQGERRRKGCERASNNDCVKSVRTNSLHTNFDERHGLTKKQDMLPKHDTKTPQKSHSKHKRNDSTSMAEHFEQLDLSISPSPVPAEIPECKNKHCGNLVSFSKRITDDIKHFLTSHRLETQKRPCPSSSLSLQKFQRQHPELYIKAKKRSFLKDADIDALNQHLCSKFPQYLVDSSNVYGCVQRLEDLVDFIVARYMIVMRNE